MSNEEALQAHDANATAAGTMARWHDGPAAKQRTAVQHMVRGLLDSLAPERAPARAPQPPLPVQLVRSPRGCILQAAACAVSVSWFPASNGDAALGELQVIVWRGVVSRPGSADRATGGAVPVWEALLRPAGVNGDAWAWRTADGAVCDTATLAARCRALLEDQMTPDAPALRAG